MPEKHIPAFRFMVSEGLTNQRPGGLETEGTSGIMTTYL
jgi:hypothetical protein